ncbi:hypothetical protein I4U23_000314 [Adineta vaga]|nr:hypothetical protein I4U23_000314 [Adineta vaga]
MDCSTDSTEIPTITIDKPKKNVSQKKIFFLVMGTVACAVMIILAIVLYLVISRKDAIPLANNLSIRTSTSVEGILTYYPGTLTNTSYKYVQLSYVYRYYYEAIQVTVSISGVYTFTDLGTMDSYGYLYKNDPQPIDTCGNLLIENDDMNEDSTQFQIQYTLQSDMVYILIVSTYDAETFGEFRIRAMGPDIVDFHRINDDYGPLASDSLSLLSNNEVVYGVFNTIAGNDNIAATAGSGIGKYPSAESPSNACDNYQTTKYLSFGPCTGQTLDGSCGLNTGFYLTLTRGLSTMFGVQFCTANDWQQRDPSRITIEGSNESGDDLIRGSSWNLIYNGTTGFSSYRERQTCYSIQYFCNSIPYTSYRVLITAKFESSNSVQYSEVKFYGK